MRFFCARGLVAQEVAALGGETPAVGGEVEAGTTLDAGETGGSTIMSTRLASSSSATSTSISDIGTGLGCARLVLHPVDPAAAGAGP